jgi:glycosyltransferase involved in cell wall biosynthesis
VPDPEHCTTRRLMPRVSIITPCFNAEKFLARTIDAVLVQTLASLEYIVVDDGSTDSSAAIIASAARVDPRVRLVRQPNAGSSAARNRGFAEASATSEYLYFVDADDGPEPTMLERMVGYLDAHPDAGIVFCDRRRVDADDTELEPDHFDRFVPRRWGVRRLHPTEPVTPFAAILCGAPMIPSASVIRRSVYERTPGWDPHFGVTYREDTDLFLSCSLVAEVHYVPERLVNYRKHTNQSTANHPKFAAEDEKLIVKWSSGVGLAGEHWDVVEAALQFAAGPMALFDGVSGGTRALRARNLPLAARFYGGATRRYLEWAVRQLGRRTNKGTGVTPRQDAEIEMNAASHTARRH